MDIQATLELLKNEQPVVVRGKTFTPEGIEKIHLDTGEVQYWIKSRDHIWLSIDPDSEEVMMFEDIDEELEAMDDVVPYGGEDYELSVEQSGKVHDEEGEYMDSVEFRDYESQRGEIIRLTEYEVSEDTIDVALGQIITEDDLQEA